ncbi:hypothetical protein FALCPG4_014541 [Fusarium falciforme]
MSNDGLVCWGLISESGMDRGTPWDRRSWEAKGWFLRKWWWLVGPGWRALAIVHAVGVTKGREDIDAGEEHRRSGYRRGGLRGWYTLMSVKLPGYHAQLEIDHGVLSSQNRAIGDK